MDHGHSCWVDIEKRPCDGPQVARKSGAIGQPDARLWRCYSPSTLVHGNWSHGSCYCSLDAELRQVLAQCGTPDPSPPPPPPPPPPALGVSVFTSGKEGYHTYRIPAIVSGPGGKLLCFAEGRKFSSSDHGWNDIVVKSSADHGQTWSPLRLVWGESSGSSPNGWVTIGNPAPVAVVTQPGKVVLVFCRNNLEVGVMVSQDWGLTWGTKPRYLPKNGSWPWVATGPPQGIQLPSGTRTNAVECPAQPPPLSPHPPTDLLERWAVCAVLRACGQSWSAGPCAQRCVRVVVTANACRAGAALCDRPTARRLGPPCGESRPSVQPQHALR